MTRFSGEVGFAVTVEQAEGVWDDVVTERTYFGDVQRNTLRREDGEAINSEISLSHVISIVADDFATENVVNIRYVKWAGTLWKVVSAEIQSPRLLLRLGGVYVGNTA